MRELEGTWKATLYQFTDNAKPTQQKELIAQGASFELAVNADGTATTFFEDGQGWMNSEPGALNPDGKTLTIAGKTFNAQWLGDVLMLTDKTNAYDFDESGKDVSATLLIQMKRL